MKAKITSEYLTKLRTWSRKGSKHKAFRIGITVETPRGVGIITHKLADKLCVAVKPDRPNEPMPCYQFFYRIEDVKLSDQRVPRDSRLFFGAWSNIEAEALNANQTFEVERQASIVAEYESRVNAQRTDRKINAEFGASTYRRYIGTNSRGETFDFEINITRPFIPAGDRILFALAADDGYIADMNGHGRIYRRKIKDSDINYGWAKYAGPQEEAE